MPRTRSRRSPPPPTPDQEFADMERSQEKLEKRINADEARINDAITVAAVDELEVALA